MDYVTLLGTQQNGEWMAFAYDIHTPYGYESMLSLFDKFISSYMFRIDCIAKARIAGQNQTFIWKRSLFPLTKPLSNIPALKEECGEVAIGGKIYGFNGIRLYITLINQTSMVTIQIPTNQLSEKSKKKIEDIARFLQSNN